MHIKLGRTAALTVASGVALLLAGCGGSGDSSTAIQKSAKHYSCEGDNCDPDKVRVRLSTLLEGVGNDPTQQREGGEWMQATLVRCAMEAGLENTPEPWPKPQLDLYWACMADAVSEREKAAGK